MHSDDIDEIAKIHSQQFTRQLHSEKWVSCNFAAFPRIIIFVARDELDNVVGYVQWIHKSGFRKESVIELEQIAVRKDQQRKGIGSKLIIDSLKLIKEYLSEYNSILQTILITTRSDNQAQLLYKNTLGAEVISIIKDLYSHDEVIMLAHYTFSHFSKDALL